METEQQTKERLMQLVKDVLEETKGDKYKTISKIMDLAEKDRWLMLDLAMYGHVIAKALEESRLAVKH